MKPDCSDGVRPAAGTCGMMALFCKNLPDGDRRQQGNTVVFALLCRYIY